MTAIFTVGRTDLRRTEWQERPDKPLDPGEARLRIDRFALTANNITYGAFGEGMSYWSFFPTGDASTGCIPVWGFATVTESLCEGVAVGERFYGYYPIADEVVLQPVTIDAHRFIDGAPHRRELHGLYNQYLRCSNDPLYRPDDEDVLALYRPLFTTSFLIDDFLADNTFFGAAEVLISSASSKTAYGLGFCLAARRAAGGGVPSIGLTSPANLAFTAGLGCYDEVATYAEVARLSPDVPAVYVDMSGDAALRLTIHGHWQDRLAYSCSVGGTHWEGLGNGKGLPGPRPVLFFAPAQGKKRVAEWGPAGFQDRLAGAWSAFLGRARDPARPWLQVVPGRGRPAVESTYAALLDGKVPANEGRILAV
ncbi:MAG: DUF2855 family protein [Caldimonas sp.]